MLASILVWGILLVISILYVNKDRNKSPPGPLRLPIIGSAWALGPNTTQLHANFTRLAKKWGPIMRVDIGYQSLVILTDPDIIKETFHDLDSPFITRLVSKTTMQMNQGLSLVFAKTRKYWIFMRKLSMPLTRNHISGTPIVQVIMEEINKLCEEINRNLDEEVYLNPLFMFFTRNVFLRLSISKSWSFNSKNEEEINFNKSMIALMENMTSLAEFWPPLDFLATRSRKTSLDNNKQLEKYFMKVAEDRKNDAISSDESIRDLLDIYIREKRTNPDFTDEAMYSSLTFIMIAGTLTSADTIDWILLYLSTNPELQEKCYEEIKGKLNGRHPTMGDQADLPYLESAIKETFRLRPPAPLSLPHIAEEDCKIKNYEIKKGTVILQNLYGIGNWDKFFENSSVFDPDRWTRNPELSSNLLTFGHGPTSCLGLQIAKQEVFLTIATLLQKYKFKIGPSTPSPDFSGEFKISFNPKEWHTIISLRE